MIGDSYNPTYTIPYLTIPLVLFLRPTAGRKHWMTFLRKNATRNFRKSSCYVPTVVTPKSFNLHDNPVKWVVLEHRLKLAWLSPTINVYSATFGARDQTILQGSPSDIMVDIRALTSRHLTHSSPSGRCRRLVTTRRKIAGVPPRSRKPRDT